MDLRLKGERVHTGEGAGPLFSLGAPISFWGGVDPKTGRIVHPRHPDLGQSVRGAVLAMDRTIGSSSSSAIMLELLREGQAPAALVLGTVDAILALGVWAAEELGVQTIPILRLPRPELKRIAAFGGRLARVRGDELWINGE